VLIVEARSRPGGRVVTSRDIFSTNIELGATFIPTTHNLITKIIAKFGLPVKPIEFTEENTFFVINDLKIRGDTVLSFYPGLRSYEEQLSPFGLFGRYVISPSLGLGAPDNLDWSSERISQLDNSTFTQFLEGCGASNAAINLLRASQIGLMGDGFDHVSALAILREMTSSSATMYLIRDGTDMIVNKLVGDFSGDLLLGTTVTGIHQTNSAVHLTVRTLAGVNYIESDYAIVTAPAPLVRQIQFTPALSKRKMDAMNGLEYTSVVRLYFRLNRNPWPTRELINVFSDSPLTWVWGQPQNDRFILQAFVTGAEARRFSTMKDQDRGLLATAVLANILPETKGLIAGAYSYSWDLDAWSKGAFSWFRPGQIRDYGASLSEAEGRIYFAGEHTSAWPGWMQGAAQSGNRAAFEVMKANH
jgi:monoamine oxidase